MGSVSVKAPPTAARTYLTEHSSDHRPEPRHCAAWRPCSVGQPPPQLRAAPSQVHRGQSPGNYALYETTVNISSRQHELPAPYTGTGAREHIDRSLQRLAAEEEKLAIVLESLCVSYISSRPFNGNARRARNGRGWWIAAGVLTVLCLVCLPDAATRAKRDDRGQRIFPHHGERKLLLPVNSISGIWYLQVVTDRFTSRMARYTRT